VQFGSTPDYQISTHEMPCDDNPSYSWMVGYPETRPRLMPLSLCVEDMCD